MSTWYQGLHRCESDAERKRWQRIIALRDEVSRAIEALRKAGSIGSSLASNVCVYADAPLADDLAWLGDELRFVLLTSDASAGALDDAPADVQTVNLERGRVAVRVRPNTDPKCVRCWHQRPDVGHSAEHPELCGRCIDNVERAGENRRIA